MSAHLPLSLAACSLPLYCLFTSQSRTNYSARSAATANVPQLRAVGAQGEALPSPAVAAASAAASSSELKAGPSDCSVTSPPVAAATSCTLSTCTGRRGGGQGTMGQARRRSAAARRASGIARGRAKCRASELSAVFEDAPAQHSLQRYDRCPGLVITTQLPLWLLTRPCLHARPTFSPPHLLDLPARLPADERPHKRQHGAQEGCRGERVEAREAKWGGACAGHALGRRAPRRPPTPARNTVQTHSPMCGPRPAPGLPPSTAPLPTTPAPPPNPPEGRTSTMYWTCLRKGRGRER